MIQRAGQIKRTNNGRNYLNYKINYNYYWNWNKTKKQKKKKTVLGCQRNQKKEIQQR